MNKIEQIITSHRNKPKFYHYLCFASGTVCVLDKWGTEPTLKCPYYRDDGFNCGNKNCSTGVVQGELELEERARIENNLIEKLLQEIEEVK